MTDYNGPPRIDWSPLGDLFNVYRQAQMQTARQNSPLLAPYGGDIGLYQLATQAQRDARDFGFREQEAKRAQSNTDRAFAIQKRTAEEVARGFDYREIDDGAGGKALVKINKATGEVTKPTVAGAPDVPNNPFQQGKMNEAQSKDALYTSRMLNAERVLQDPAVVSAATSLQQQGMAKIPIAGNFMVSEAFQKYDQAQRDFINATLRRESGAVISEAEFANARKQYFPEPGDSQVRLDQKKQNRLEAIKGIGAGAGPGYKPTLSIGEGGSIVDNPAAKPKPPPGINKDTVAAARANPQAALEEARKAIASGKDPAAVKRRLQQIGIDPSGL